MSYTSADALHDAAQQACAIHVQEGLDAHPGAVPSHICIRSSSANDYNLLTLLGTGLGDLHEQDHDGRKLSWVRLHTPLTAHNLELRWLEITAPKDGVDHPTGPQMLVFQREADETIKLPSPADAGFILRFQPQAAEALAGMS